MVGSGWSRVALVALVVLGVSFGVGLAACSSEEGSDDTAAGGSGTSGGSDATGGPEAESAVPAGSLLAHVDPDTEQVRVLDAVAARAALGALPGGGDTTMLAALGAAVPEVATPTAVLGEVLDPGQVVEAVHWGPDVALGSGGPEAVTVVRTEQSMASLAEGLADAGYDEDGDGRWVDDGAVRGDPAVVVVRDDLVVLGRDADQVDAALGRDGQPDDAAWLVGLQAVAGPLRTVRVVGDGCLLAVSAGDGLDGTSTLAVGTDGEPQLSSGDFVDRRGAVVEVVAGPEAREGAEGWWVYDLATRPPGGTELDADVVVTFSPRQVVEAEPVNASLLCA